MFLVMLNFLLDFSQKCFYLFFSHDLTPCPVGASEGSTPSDDGLSPGGGAQSGPGQAGPGLPPVMAASQMGGEGWTEQRGEGWIEQRGEGWIVEQ